MVLIWLRPTTGIVLHDQYKVRSRVLREGQEWRLVVWEEAGSHCHRLEIGPGPEGDQGTICGAIDEMGQSSEAIHGRGYTPGGHRGRRFAIAHGQLRNDVARLEFHLSTGHVVPWRVIEQPPELELDVRYFVAFLPPSEHATVRALDDAGRVLQTAPLSHGE